MDNKDQTKKCYCARCFLPIDSKDRVDIEGQNFHRHCSMCCICRTIPTSLKMFYGHVFCNECFKTHVMSRFRGEPPKMHSNSWWMQWAPGCHAPMGTVNAASAEPTGPAEAMGSADPPAAGPTTGSKEEPNVQESCEKPEECDPKKRCYCARCLHVVEEGNKVDIGGQCFHPQCARCYFCHGVPTENVKIYYGQVFCEKCFHEHVLNRNKDSPNEFFKACFENWQNNAQFAEGMRTFMAGNKDVQSPQPFVFMMPPGAMPGGCPPFPMAGQPGAPGQPGMPIPIPVSMPMPGPMPGSVPCPGHSTAPGQQPHRCGMGNEWGGHNEARKSATPTVDLSDATSTWDLSFENRTDVSYPEPGSGFELETPAAAEKIAKLTKYLQSSDSNWKKWKNLEFDKIGLNDVASFGWVELKGNGSSDCPKCLWQCGPIYVNCELLRRDVCCGDVFQ